MSSLVNVFSAGRLAAEFLGRPEPSRMESRFSASGQVLYPHLVGISFLHQRNRQGQPDTP
uniref:Uncharacterized protein n=1 Tax=mine drainage metagenome TaxID=410659 RepID=E6PLL5_9ZZZZ